MLYRSQIGEAQNPPPYQFPKVKINSFRLSADLDKLTDLCNDILNVGDLEDRGFEFRPIFPFVDLEILHYPRMEYALFPPAGFISQNECYVRIFVMKYIAFGNTFVPDGEIAVFCPMLIVSNPLSAFAGRDVLGFPKLLGSFDAFSPEKPFTIVSTDVFTSYELEVEAASKPVVKIESAGRGAKAIEVPARKWPWGHIDVEIMDIAHQALGRALVFTPAIFECVTMKQFRDATLPFNACYQAILQSSTFVEFAGDLEKLPPARITLTDYPSFRLAASLGIPAGEPLTPISQYHLECSFGFGDTITLFANDRPWWWWW
jgi:hypothetical protein